MMKPLDEMNLWELDSELLTLDSAVRCLEEDVAGEGGLDGPAQDELREYLAARESELEQLFPAKAAGWIRLYLRRKALFEAAETERKRVAALAKKNGGALDRVKGVLFRVMQRLEIPRFETTSGTLLLRKNGGAEAVEKTDDQPVPLRFAAEMTLPDPESFLRLLGELYLGSPEVRLEFLSTSDRGKLELLGILSDPEAFSAAKVRAYVQKTGEIPPGFNVSRGSHLEVK